MKRRTGPGGFHGDRPRVGELPVEEDVRKELEAHIRLRTEELVAGGWEPAAAREEARRVFGSMDDVARECEEITRSGDRALRRADRWGALIGDLRFAVRSLRGSPGFAAVALITLALGIGAISAIFSVVHGVLLRPLPFEEPERIVWLREARDDGGTMSVAWVNYLDWREESTSFAGMAAYGAGVTTVLGADEPLRTVGALVGADFWTVFPVRPLRGRLTTAEDHRADAEPVAVVAESFWRNELGGGDLSAASLEAGGTRFRVVGVLPRSFDFPSGAEIWRPVEPGTKSDSRTAHNWSVVARLAPGVELERAREELNALTRRIVAREPGADPDFLAVGATVTLLRDEIVGDSRTPLYMLMGAAGLVLLVACTNLASTLLARGTNRARELAVRASLGADRRRLVRQLLTESLVLAGAGAAGGVAVAWLVLRGLRRLGPASVPRLAEIGLDVQVLAFTGGVAVLTAFLFGLLPALRLTRGGMDAALRTGTRGNAERRRLIWRVLVGIELALAMVLLAGSGLLVRSFQELLDEDAGFDASDVATVPVNLSRIRYATPGDHARYYEELLSALEARPGVVAAGVTTSLPVSGFFPSGRMELDGDLEKHAVGGYVVADRGFFEAMDIPLLRGRHFDPRDRPGSPHVALVSRSFAERFWPGENPVGRQVTGGGMDDFWQERAFATVVGVVGDVRYRDLGTEAYPTVYFPYAQRPFRTQYGATVVVEVADGDAASLAPLLRATVGERDPEVPVEVRTMEDVLGASLAERRFILLLLGGFSLVALVLAGVGIYGVVSYSVARRTREMGIRLALGAPRASVVRLVVWGAMSMAAGGLVVGVLGALLATHLLGSLLYGVGPRDPATLGVVALVLGGTALVASWIPARLGTRVDPMTTMRAE